MVCKQASNATGNSIMKVKLHWARLVLRLVGIGWYWLVLELKIKLYANKIKFEILCKNKFLFSIPKMRLNLYFY